MIDEPVTSVTIEPVAPVAAEPVVAEPVVVATIDNTINNDQSYTLVQELFVVETILLYAANN